MAGRADGRSSRNSSIPAEVIRATIRANQKCFVVSDPKTGKLTNKFILTANIEATDGGKTIAPATSGDPRSPVATRFFYETDLKTARRRACRSLEHIVFHEKLGTQARAD